MLVTRKRARIVGSTGFMACDVLHCKGKLTETDSQLLFCLFQREQAAISRVFHSVLSLLLNFSWRVRLDAYWNDRL